MNLQSRSSSDMFLQVVARSCSSVVCVCVYINEGCILHWPKLSFIAYTLAYVYDRGLITINKQDWTQLKQKGKEREHSHVHTHGRNRKKEQRSIICERQPRLWISRTKQSWKASFQLPVRDTVAALAQSGVRQHINDERFRCASEQKPGHWWIRCQINLFLKS